MKKRYRLLFTGLVQGVSFRFTARHLANKYRLKGWARNNVDGNVELEIEGKDEALNSFLSELQEEFKNNIISFQKEGLPVSEKEDSFQIKL